MFATRRRWIGLTAAALLPLAACGSDASGPEKVWKVDFSPGAGGAAYFDGGVWLGVTDDGDYPDSGRHSLLRLDPADGSIDLRTAVPDALGVAGVVDDTLWVISGNQLESVDPATGELSSGGLDGDGSVDTSWSLASAGGRLFGRTDWTLMEIDPATGEILGEVARPADSAGNDPEVFPAPIIGRGDVLYLTTTDRSSPVIAAYEVVADDYAWVTSVERDPVGLVILEDRLWVLVSRPNMSQLLLAYDLATGEQVIEARLPEGTSMIDRGGNISLRAADDGTLWVMSGADSTIFRVDPATGAAVEQFRLSQRPTEFIVTATSVIALSANHDRVMMVPRDAFEPVAAAAP